MMKNENGNVFIYILIAVILFGGLMFVMSKSASQEDAGSELDEGNVKIAANEIVSFSSSVSNSLAQMEQSGATADQIDFILPSDAAFNTAPTLYKLFHPDGGGLNYRPLPAKATNDDGAGLSAGYYIGRFSSVEWTPSATNDIILTAYEIKQNVCAELNRKITGSTTIPTVVGESLQNLFVDDGLHAGANANFVVGNCAACENQPSLCVTDGASKYAFYSIIEAE